MLALFSSLLLQTFSAQAIVTSPTLEAADSLGLDVAGEIEFSAYSHVASTTALRESLNSIQEICPRTQAIENPVSKTTHVVVVAWSDREFPKERQSYAHADVALANQRATGIAAALRRELRGPTSFDLVNMASRQPHKIKLNERAQNPGSETDIKAALALAGAAPIGVLQLGLFGEYAQKSKAIILVECNESFLRRPLAQRADNRLAALERIASAAVLN